MQPGRPALTWVSGFGAWIGMLFVDHYHTNPVLVSFCQILITSHKDGKLQKTVKYWCLNQSAGNVSCSDLCWVQSGKWIPMDSQGCSGGTISPSHCPCSASLYAKLLGRHSSHHSSCMVVLQTGSPAYSGTEPRFCRHSYLNPIVLGCHYIPQATRQI